MAENGAFDPTCSVVTTVNESTSVDELRSESTSVDELRSDGNSSDNDTKFPELMKHFVDMGFGHRAAEEALSVTNGDLPLSTSMLLNIDHYNILKEMGFDCLATVEALDASSSFEQALEILQRQERYHVLQELGFSMSSIETALKKSNGDVDGAAALLLNPEIDTSLQSTKTFFGTVKSFWGYASESANAASEKAQARFKALNDSISARASMALEKSTFMNEDLTSRVSISSISLKESAVAFTKQVETKASIFAESSKTAISSALEQAADLDDDFGVSETIAEYLSAGVESLERRFSWLKASRDNMDPGAGQSGCAVNRDLLSFPANGELMGKDGEGDCGLSTIGTEGGNGGGSGAGGVGMDFLYVDAASTSPGKVYGTDSRAGERVNPMVGRPITLRRGSKTAEGTEVGTSGDSEKAIGASMLMDLVYVDVASTSPGKVDGTDDRAVERVNPLAGRPITLRRGSRRGSGTELGAAQAVAMGQDAESGTGAGTGPGQDAGTEAITGGDCVNAGGDTSQYLPSSRRGSKSLPTAVNDGEGGRGNASALLSAVPRGRLHVPRPGGGRGVGGGARVGISVGAGAELSPSETVVNSASQQEAISSSEADATSDGADDNLRGFFGRDEGDEGESSGSFESYWSLDSNSTGISTAGLTSTASPTLPDPSDAEVTEDTPRDSEADPEPDADCVDSGWREFHDTN